MNCFKACPSHFHSVVIPSRGGSSFPPTGGQSVPPIGLRRPPSASPSPAAPSRLHSRTPTSRLLSCSLDSPVDSSVVPGLPPPHPCQGICGSGSPRPSGEALFPERLGLGETLQAPAEKWIQAEASCSGSCSWLPASDPALSENQVIHTARPGAPCAQHPSPGTWRARKALNAQPFCPLSSASLSGFSSAHS